MWEHLHPALSSFPPALLILVAGLEVASYFGVQQLRRSIDIILLLAVVFVLAAFFSGYDAAETANRTFIVAEHAIAEHHNIGRLLAILIIPCAALEQIAQRARHGQKFFWSLYLALLTVCVALVVWTGYEGGELVFKHGAGVSATLPKS